MLIKRWAAMGAMVAATGCGGSGSGRMLPAPMREVRVFAPGSVSDGHAFMAAFMPDQRTVYYVRRTYPDRSGPATLVIMESQRRGEEWAPGRPASFSGRWPDIDPVVAPGGRRLWFNSTRPAPGRDSSRTDFDIWYVDRVGDGWGAPIRLPPPVNTERSEYYASVTRDGTLYFTSAEMGPTRVSTLVRARRSAAGGYPSVETVSLGSGQANPGNPSIAPDESYLLFVAGGGPGKDSDIFIVHRQGAGWGTPINLGPPVNGPMAEFAPSVSPDGKKLYFTRMERGADRLAISENVMVTEWRPPPER